MCLRGVKPCQTHPEDWYGGNRSFISLWRTLDRCWEIVCNLPFLRRLSKSYMDPVLGGKQVVQPSYYGGKPSEFQRFILSWFCFVFGLYLKKKKNHSHQIPSLLNVIQNRYELRTEIQIACELWMDTSFFHFWWLGSTDSTCFLFEVLKNWDAEALNTCAYSKPILSMLVSAHPIMHFSTNANKPY